MSALETAERNFKGVWIPKEIWLARDLSLVEKVMMVEIDSLQDKHRGCYASNGHFAEFFDLSKSRVSEIISSLVKKNMLAITQIRDGRQVVERQLRVIPRMPEPPSENGEKPLRKRRRTPSEKAANPIGKGAEPPSENGEGSNPTLSNTDNSTGEGVPPDDSSNGAQGVEGEYLPAPVEPVQAEKTGHLTELLEQMRQRRPVDMPGPKNFVEARTADVWTAYAWRYKKVYKHYPLWNAQTGNQLSRLIDRVGAEAAPFVAATYLRLTNALYAKRHHPVDLLLKDCEAIYSQWQTNTTMTDAKARQIDQTQANTSTAEELEASIRARFAAREANANS